MKIFIKRLLGFTVVGIMPIIVVIFGYLYFDPFKVLYDYRDYSYLYVSPNRDFISTSIFRRNYEKYKYNSFIFGSSRTLAYRPISWVKHLDENAHPFLFDASAESVYGIYTKIKFLDSMNVKMDNALIILCRDASFEFSTNQNGHLFIKHPVISGESTFDAQFEFFKAFLNPKLLFSFCVYTVTKEYKPFMAGYVEYRKIKMDTVTNEISIIDQEEEITQNPAQYYLKRKDLFYKRSDLGIDTVQRIKASHLNMLKEIKRILEKNNVNYRIVLSPLYEQIKFSNPDKQILSNLFNDKLFDFSGKNSFTEPITNYYEISHYRTSVGDSILNLIYK